MRFTSPLTLVSRALDRFTGISSLTSVQRKHVLAAQIRATIGLTPVMLFIAFVFSVTLVAINWDHVDQTLGMVLIIASLPIHYSAFRAWWSDFRNPHPRQKSGASGIRRASFRALEAALYYGAFAMITVPAAPSDNAVPTAVILTSAFIVTAFSFSAIAQAMILFIAVSGVMSVAAFMLAPDKINLGLNLLINGGYMVLMPFIAVYSSRLFVARVASDLKNRDSAEVISYLLNEFESTADEWFWEIDSNRKLERMSVKFRETTKISDKRLEKVDFIDLLEEMAGPDSDAVRQIEEAITNQTPFDHVEFQATIDDEVRWFSIAGKPTFLSRKSFTGFLGTVKDITNQKKTENQIVELAHRDALTGLLNRTSFTKVLNDSVKLLERDGKPFTLLFLDLDKFKLVNDTFGHPVGDQLLRDVTARIQGVLREGDPFARLGGDEFAIILEENCDPVFAAKLASRLINAVLAPYVIDGETMWIGVSVGIAIAPQHGTQPDQILRNADLALYRAKEDGRGVFRYFEVQMDFEQREKRMLEQEMHQALENDEFHLCYQPLISTKTGRISTMEALIRWNHPIRDQVSPTEFIAIAEQSTLVVDIGRWTLMQACKAALDWPEEVGVAVNIAATHFIRGDIVGDVKHVIEETGINATRLEIEITESLLIKDSEDVLVKLKALKQLGCTIVMDDFGTGYSSLSYIMKFPFDKLKIDRSFVSDMDKGKNAKAILLAISSLGENTGIKITAEGVETEQQCKYLLGICCDQLQGYFFSRPIPHEEVAGFMMRNFLETVPGIGVAGFEKPKLIAGKSVA